MNEDVEQELLEEEMNPRKFWHELIYCDACECVTTHVKDAEDDDFTCLVCELKKER